MLDTELNHHAMFDSQPPTQGFMGKSYKLNHYVW